MELKIEYMALEKLKPYEKNARKHQEADLSTIKASITEFGMSDPIGVWGKDNIIVEGHGRYLACKELGIAEVPVIHLDHLSDEQRRAYALAHNKTAEMSEWDFDLLGDELADIFDIDMSDFGFDFAEDEEEETEVIEDEIPEEVEPVAKMGDIWQLGRHRLMCGDSTSVDNMNKLFDGNTIDLVLSDPPYGISVVGDNGKVGADNLAKNGIYMPVKGDETTDTTKEFYNACVSKDIDKYILFGGNYFIDFLPFSDSWIIWDKRGDMASNNFADGEMAWCSFHTPVRIYKQVWSGMIKEGEHEKRVHPTQKPIRMLCDILKDFSKENENIFDGFGGSGSTLIACEQTNRNCYMIEYEPHYVDVIIARWEQFTGQKAVLING